MDMARLQTKLRSKRIWSVCIALARIPEAIESTEGISDTKDVVGKHANDVKMVMETLGDVPLRVAEYAIRQPSKLIIRLDESYESARAASPIR